MECIREQTEKFEEQILSKSATLAINSKGRKIAEEKCPLRTDFQRDRDRIIHSKAFRRLKHKTQVFLSPESDHYRTRLTHTLEVAQIARTVSRALRLNEDLTEAIALGHDLGHTPFGHAGERALNDLFGNFTHYEQSVRVCEILEKPGGGLNLTYEVLDGIVNHTKGEWAHTPEGRVVRISDHIAYMNHDIEDAIRAEVINDNDIPKDITEFLGDTKTKRITKLVTSLVNNSIGNDIKFDSETQLYYDKMHDFLYESIYYNPVAKAEESKVEGLIAGIYKYFCENPRKLTDEYKTVCENEGVERAVTDYIAGMTDHYAVTVYNEIYVPKSWEV